MGWITLAMFLQCMAFQCNVEADNIRHRARKQVKYIEKEICRSWSPSVHIPTQHSLEVTVRFNGFCHRLPLFTPFGFTWAFDVKHSPSIPNTEKGRLERFFCNCLDKKPCTKTYTDLLLEHNVMYNFTIIPHCFNDLCDNCVRLMYRRTWRNESIIVVPTEKFVSEVSNEEPKPNKTDLLGPVLVGLVLLTAMFVVLGIFCRSRLLTLCKTQCRRKKQNSTNDTKYNPNNLVQTESGECTPMLQPKKKVLLLHEAKHNQTIIKCLSANPVMKEYITVDNINDIKQNVNDNFTSNMFEMYNSVILVFENWIISESGVVGGIDRGYRRIIQNILISFKDGSVNSDKNLHVLLIEESEAKYEDFRSKYESVNSTPYYQLRDGILPSVIHLLVNICSDRMEKEITNTCNTPDQTDDSSQMNTKNFMSNYKYRFKKILLLAESNVNEYSTLVSVFQALKSHISVDDINTLINLPKIAANKYDWAFNVEDIYETVVVLQQDWMVRENVEHAETVVKTPIEELTEIVLRRHYDRKRKFNLYAVMRDSNREVLEKFMSYYSINEEVVFTLSADMDFNGILHQMAYLVFSILAER